MTRPNPDEYGVNPLSPLSPEEADQFAKMLLRVLPLEVIASIENALDDTHFPGNILVLQRRINWRGDSCEEIEPSTAPLRSFHDS